MRHKPNPATQCQHRTKDRKQCQMPARELSQLCPHHQRTAANQIYQSIQPGGCSGGSLDPFFSSRRQNTRSAEEIEALATALLTNTNNLSDPAQVNQFLANLLNQLAHNKISRKNAIAMAYISQLLLNSISVKHKQDRDAQAAQQAANANKPTQIVIDMPRPNYDRSPDLRSGESSDSHSVDVPVGAPFYPACPDEGREPRRSDSHSVDAPLATPLPNDAPKNPPPPPDDPPTSTHPQHTSLPRWGEQHFPNGTYSEPSRPNQFGPPRMSARRTQRYANLKVRHNESTRLKSHLFGLPRGEVDENPTGNGSRFDKDV